MASNEPTNDLLTILGGFRTSDRLSRAEDVLPAGVANEGGAGDALAQLTAQIVQLRSTNQAQIDAMADNTKALVDDATVKSQGGASSVASTVGEVFSEVFGSALGLSPLISGIASLFGGGSKPAPPPLIPYAAPAPVRFDGGISSTNPGSVAAVDYSQDGQVRAIPASTSVPAQQITIQVQAMDSQSFLDHSEDIARAVRQAMLNSNALSDVVGEM